MLYGLFGVLILALILIANIKSEQRVLPKKKYLITVDKFVIMAICALLFLILSLQSVRSNGDLFSYYSRYNMIQHTETKSFLHTVWKQKDPITGNEIGWNNAAFYWPVLLTQEKLDPVMYALDSKKHSQVFVVDNSSILEGINPDEVLRLTYSGDLEEHFGKEGTDYSNSDVTDWPVETRALKDTTASKYLQKNADGTFVRNSLVKFDEANDHGIYSRNKNVFPFILKPYKYILLSNGRDSMADFMLLELADRDMWHVCPEGGLDDDGELRDIDTGSILLHGEDYIMSKQMKKKLVRDETITQWVICYPIKKVLRFKKNSTMDRIEELEES